MNAYCKMGLILAYTIAVFTAGWRTESWRWEASLAKSAEHALGEVKTQDNISTEATNENAKDEIAIDAAYSDSVQQSTRDLPPLPKPAAGACTTRSKVYKLTPIQCDLEESKCNALWNWAQAQAKVK